MSIVIDRSPKYALMAKQGLRPLFPVYAQDLYLMKGAFPQEGRIRIYNTSDYLAVAAEWEMIKQNAHNIQLEFVLSGNGEGDFFSSTDENRQAKISNEFEAFLNKVKDCAFKSIDVFAPSRARTGNTMQYILTRINPNGLYDQFVKAMIMNFQQVFEFNFSFELMHNQDLKTTWAPLSKLANNYAVRFWNYEIPYVVLGKESNAGWVYHVPESLTEDKGLGDMCRNVLNGRVYEKENIPVTLFDLALPILYDAELKEEGGQKVVNKMVEYGFDDLYNGRLTDEAMRLLLADLGIPVPANYKGSRIPTAPGPAFQTRGPLTLAERRNIVYENEGTVILQELTEEGEVIPIPSKRVPPRTNRPPRSANMEADTSVQGLISRYEDELPQAAPMVRVTPGKPTKGPPLNRGRESAPMEYRPNYEEMAEAARAYSENPREGYTERSVPSGKPQKGPPLDTRQRSGAFYPGMSRAEIMEGSEEIPPREGYTQLSREPPRKSVSPFASKKPQKGPPLQRPGAMYAGEEGVEEYTESTRVPRREEYMESTRVPQRGEYTESAREPPRKSGPAFASKKPQKGPPLHVIRSQSEYTEPPMESPRGERQTVVRIETVTTSRRPMMFSNRELQESDGYL